MENEKLKIQVLDVSSNQVLFECSLEDSQKAYVFAGEMEDIGLHVKVLNPTLAETLTNSLGLSHEKTLEYFKSMDHELEEHEGSCCVDNSAK